MKKTIISLLTIVIAITATSCQKDDENKNELTGKNTVSFDFDTGFNGQAMVLGQEYTLNGEKLKISAFDYIVGNFVLVKDDGTEYTYPKEKSFFIISEGGKKFNKATKEDKNMPKINAVKLQDVPAGKYTKVKFGIGIDEDTYKGGKQFANKLWERAEAYSLVWSWATGYKFSVLEGAVKIGEENKNFKYHVAAAANEGAYKAGKELYKTITLNLDQAFVVSKDKSPQLHLRVDASKMLNGDSKIEVSKTPVLMGPKTKDIAKNSESMFTFDHVHYNSGKH